MCLLFFLRWGLPIDSKEARDLQEAIEDVKDGIRSKRLSAAKSDAQKVRGVLERERGCCSVEFVSVSVLKR
jgi:hypothetical protein